MKESSCVVASSVEFKHAVSQAESAGGFRGWGGSG